MARNPFSWIHFIIFAISPLSSSPYHTQTPETHSIAVIVVANLEGVHLRNCLSRAVAEARRFTLSHSVDGVGAMKMPVSVIETAPNEPASFRRQALSAAIAAFPLGAVNMVYNDSPRRLNVSQIFRRGIAAVAAVAAAAGAREPELLLFLDDAMELADGAVMELAVAAEKNPAAAIVGAESR